MGAATEEGSISGADLRYIQSLMGYNSSETTEIYTHITQKAREKFCRPLDFLEI